MSSNNSTKESATPFTSRFIELFGTEEPAVIQRKLGVNYQSAKNYLQGRKPNADVLEKIVEKTGVSLNWLLMGQEPKYLRHEFDLEYSIERHDDWHGVLDEWYQFEGRTNPYPDMGTAFMGGWESFSREEQVKAIRDLKTMYDRFASTANNEELSQEDREA